MGKFDVNAAHAEARAHMGDAFNAERKANRNPMKFTGGILAGLMRMAGVAFSDATNHIAALEKRVADLEAQQSKGMQYRGIWRSSESYDRGDWITFRGSAWHCDRSTGQSPADDPTAWTLAVKRGRDSKGAHHYDE